MVCTSRLWRPTRYSSFGDSLPIAAMALGHVRHQTVGETMQSAGATSLLQKEITAAWVEAFLSCSAVVPSRMLYSRSSPGPLAGLESDINSTGANEPSSAHLTPGYRHSTGTVLADRRLDLRPDELIRSYRRHDPIEFPLRRHGVGWSPHQTVGQNRQRPFLRHL